MLLTLWQTNSHYASTQVSCLLVNIYCIYERIFRLGAKSIGLPARCHGYTAKNPISFLQHKTFVLHSMQVNVQTTVPCVFAMSV